MTHALSSSYFAAVPAQKDAAPASESTHLIAGVVLAALVSALLVAADKVIDLWTDGRLVLGWVALWTVAFGALAVLASPLRKVSVAASVAIMDWVHARKIRRMEEKMWEYAHHDPRIMLELQHAWARSQA